MRDEDRRQKIGRDQMRNENGEDRSRPEYLHHLVYNDRLRNDVLSDGMGGWHSVTRTSSAIRRSPVYEYGRCIILSLERHKDVI